ncbi:MAG: di-trans,poly-cis-decaprenylcistransferase [Acidobacteria bacterium]|nr:di-trans,poly-cis-decaprenylcistransferase [Acidobacteriota bacterium]
MQILYDNKDFIKDSKKFVKHLAVIMDGNGRWAEQRGLPRWKGHEMGVHAVRRLIEAAGHFRIPVVSVFAFSSENWKRPEREVRLLFSLFRRYFLSERKNLLRNGIRISVFGRRDRIPEFVREAVTTLENETRKCSRLHLRIALDYGSRHEIVEAVHSLVRDVVSRKIMPEQITEELFSESLSTADIADPDLIIRTAGEHRLSNFLLWQAAYSELYFCPKFWPDFSEFDLEKALADFQSRTRRFGALVASNIYQSDNRDASSEAV